MWAGGTIGGDAAQYTPPEIIAEMRELGLNKQADYLEKRSESAGFIVEPDNWEAFLIFTSVADQWVFAGFGSITALNGSFLLDYLRTCITTDSSEIKRLYHDIQRIAHGAIKYWHEQTNTKK